MEHVFWEEKPVLSAAAGTPFIHTNCRKPSAVFYADGFFDKKKTVLPQERSS